MPAVNRASFRTRSKILKTAIDLFNRHGVQGVSLEQIAAKAGISRGNLTYHFKRKQDVVLGSLTVLEEQMRLALAPAPRVTTPQSGAEYMIHIVEALWNFRFFFNDLSHLLTGDKLLRQRYFLFQHWTIDTLDRGLQEMVDVGDLTPMRAPNGTRVLAQNMWGQWLAWLHMQHIESPAALKPKGAALYECALHHWALIEPYFSESYARALLESHRQLLLGPKTRKAAT